MRVNIQAREIELIPSLRMWIERRVAFALGRFGTLIRAVRVTLSDTNGPRGGMDIHCVVEAKLERRGSVVVEVDHADAGAAVSRAVERLARRVGDALERRRDLRRRSLPEPSSL